MDIIIIGSGNVAHVLGRRIRESGFRIRQVVSRNETQGPLLAELLESSWTGDLHACDPYGDLYIVALSDDALHGLGKSWKAAQGIVVHTAGSVPKDVLQGISSRYGVLYPLQSLRQGVEVLPIIPLLVDGSDEQVTDTLEEFAQQLGCPVSRASDNKRLHAHIAAVISSNFSNHLFALTEQYLKEEGLPFDLILPLLRETVDRLSAYPPSAMQTGPAVRGDHTTIRRHLRELEDYPDLYDIYETLSASIERFHRR